MKKKTKKTTGKKGEKEKRVNERADDDGSSCGAGNAACGSSSRSDCAWCGAKEGSIPGILKHHQCGRCKLTFYCSKNCQKRHWKEGGHKHNCVAPADRKASAALDAARIKKDKALDNGKAAADDGNQPYDHDENDDENDECAMCLESLASARVLRLPCSHVYHVECVGKLREFGIKQVCPMCRADLPPGPEQLYDDAMRRYMVLYRRYNQGTAYTQWRIRSVEDRQSAEKMVHMLEEAAHQGHKNAQGILGAMYKNGQGVAQDDSAAMKWWRMAADQGDAQAQYNLGGMYYQGKGVPQNTSEALRWLHKAQVQGDEIAKQGIELIMQAMRETRASQQTNNSSMPPPPSASPVPIGTRVELHGLKAKPQLNGQYGIVVGYVASSGRCTVVLEGARGETKSKMNIKPENLKWK